MRRIIGAVVGFSLGLVFGLAAIAGSQNATTIANWPAVALHVICDSGCAAGGGGLTDAQLRATPVPVSGTLSATVSGTVTASGPVTDTQLRATPVPVSGTVTASGPVTDTQLRATPVPISGTVTANVGSGTQPVSGTIAVSNFPATQPVSGTVAATQSGTWTVQPGNTPNTAAWLVSLPPATLGVTALSGANAAVTATLPAVASQFHYITALKIVRTCTTAIVGTAALAVTTTNLPGSMAWTTGNACAVGSSNDVLTHDFSSPLKSSALNTNTTIVCPALGAAGICRITVHYFTGT